MRTDWLAAGWGFQGLTHGRAGKFSNYRLHRNRGAEQGAQLAGSKLGASAQRIVPTADATRLHLWRTREASQQRSSALKSEIKALPPRSSSRRAAGTAFGKSELEHPVASRFVWGLGEILGVPQ